MFSVAHCSSASLALAGSLYSGRCTDVVATQYVCLSAEPVKTVQVILFCMVSPDEFTGVVSPFLWPNFFVP